MTRQRFSVLLIALLLILLSWWGVAAARSGLVVRTLERDRLPMLYIAPQREMMPGVLVAHGFAGSKQLMSGYAQVLAHAGYAVMLWDFSGHGANTTPLEGVSLQKDLDIAYKTLLEQPGVDPTRLALLGHSMGSGAVMSAGISNAERFAATIAISPTGAVVTPQVPHNLQLQAGGWEGRFITNAQRLLKEAGGESKNLSQGRGRSLVIVPNAEHITILFRNISHQAARQWLDATFGVQSTSSYVDRRMIWYGLHLLAWLMVLGSVAPIALSSSADSMKVPPRSLVEVRVEALKGSLLLALHFAPATTAFVFRPRLLVVPLPMLKTRANRQALAEATTVDVPESTTTVAKLPVPSPQKQPKAAQKVPPLSPPLVL